MRIPGLPRSAIIADDSAEMRRLIRRILQSAGLGFESFEEAANGVEVMELAWRGRPDLILTDLRMPKMDGAEMLVKLGASDLVAIPVIVVSTEADVKMLQSLGAKGCVKKPFTAAVLVAEVRRVLEMG